MSNVKRTELEILDKAISLACENENLRHQLQKAKESKMCCACHKDEPKLKKEDFEGLRRIYENKLDDQRELLRAEKQKEVLETELYEKMQASDKAIELLRWLYKEQLNDMENN